MRLSLGARAALGAPVDIILTLPNGERLHLPGTVAHLGAGSTGDIGVRFDELAPLTTEVSAPDLDDSGGGADAVAKNQDHPARAADQEKRADSCAPGFSPSRCCS